MLEKAEYISLATLGVRRPAGDTTEDIARPPLKIRIVNYHDAQLVTWIQRTKRDWH